MRFKYTTGTLDCLAWRWIFLARMASLAIWNGEPLTFRRIWAPAAA